MGFEGEQYTRNGDTFEVLPDMGLWYPRYWTVNPEYWSPPVDILAPVAQASLEQGARYFTPDNAFVWPGDLATSVDAAEQYYRGSVYPLRLGRMVDGPVGPVRPGLVRRRRAGHDRLRQDRSQVAGRQSAGPA